MISYHDVYVTTPTIARTALFNLPYSFMITCTRIAGWELWYDSTLVAGEFDAVRPLTLDVNGEVVCSRPEHPEILRHRVIGTAVKNN